MWPSDYRIIYCGTCCVVVEKAPAFRGAASVFCPSCLATSSRVTAEAECSAAAVFYANPKNMRRRGVFRFLPAGKAMAFAAMDAPASARASQDFLKTAAE